MDFFSKDTLFNDLPANIKQRIINLRNASIQPKKAETAGFKVFDSVPVPNINALYKDFTRMAQCCGNLKECDVTEETKKELKEFEEFVGLYKMEINNTDFVAELERTIGLMEDKFSKITKELGMY